MVGYSLITPERATEILNNNTYNRPLRAGKVEQYARDMVEGRWMKNGSTIVLAHDGTLMDGQHRLFAVIEACGSVGCKLRGIEMIIVRDADKEALPTIDTGLPRSYADYKKLSGNGSGHHVSYPNELQGALRLTYWYENTWPGLPRGGRGMTASHMELDRVLERHPTFLEAVGDVASQKRLRMLGSASTTAFVYANAAEGYPNEARAWLEILRTGEGPARHPAVLLREKLIAKRIGGAPLDQPTRIVYLIKSWNAFAKGETPAQLRWGTEEPIPAIYGTKNYTGKMAAHTKVFQLAQAAPDQRTKTNIQRKGIRRRPRKVS